MAKNAAKVRASTQAHLDFEDISDDLIIFKTGWVGLVLSATAVNFDLLSEAEQDATIYAYGAFLNSLTFPVEILVRSKKADITAYFNSLQEAERTQLNPDLKKQIQKYLEFIGSIVQQKTVLDKKFYIIINFSPLELGLVGLGKKNLAAAKSKRQLLDEARASLYPKRDHITKQLARLGLTARQLTTQELIELFYDIYNPAPVGTQRVILESASYTIPIVEPAVEVPTPAPAPTGAGGTEETGGQRDRAQEVQTAPPHQEPNLRPAPPSPTTPAGVVQPAPRSPEWKPKDEVGPAPQPATLPGSEANLSDNQQAALEALQTAASRAAQLATSQKPPITTAVNGQAPTPTGAGQVQQKP